MDDDNIAVVPIEDVKIAPKTLIEKVKRPMTEKQQASLAKLVEGNKKRWELIRETKQKAAEEEKERLREEIRKEVEAKIAAGTHVRVKVVKGNSGPKKKGRPSSAVPAPPAPSQVSDVTTDVETTDVETTDMESDDELPPRRVVRQARKQLKTLSKIDEAIQQASNPYMSKLMGRWK